MRAKFIQLKKFLSIEEPKIEPEKMDQIKSAVISLQGELTKQRLITETVSEENLELRSRIARMELETTKIAQRLDELDQFKKIRPITAIRI